MGIATIALSLLVLACGMAATQTPAAPQPVDFTGIWQGTLQAPNKNLRIIFKISKDGGGLRAVLYSIDKSSDGALAASVALDGTKIKITLPSLSGIYQGDVALDGSGITGYWAGEYYEAPLNLQRATAETAWPIGTGHQESPEASLDFEVATIKPSDPDHCCSRTWGSTGRHFTITNFYLRYLIQFAYGLQADQIIGPAWIDQDRFDVAGVVDGDDHPTEHQWKIALQKLLADRFQLQFHQEKRELPAYALVVAKGGPKLTRSDGDLIDGESVGFGGAPGQTMYGGGTNATIADMIGQMQRILLPRPVVDETGLTGTFNFRLTFTREDPMAIGMGTLPDNAAPDLFTALRQQLGLELKPVKAPVEVLVIDRAEKPSAN
jgi:uncharacterized protein (TIGR03435 family)